ncbi:unnamed protein product, partial [Polarella glacialis]
QLSLRDEGSSIQAELCSLLVKRGGGSFLCGWRAELDHDFLQRATREDLYHAAEALGLSGGKADADELLMQSGTDFLSLVDVAPKVAVLVCRFRRWATSIGGARNIFRCLDVHGKGIVSPEDFAAGCRAHGFGEASESELRELFGLCDVSQNTILGPADVVFVDPDPQDHEPKELVSVGRRLFDGIVLLYNF